jgi:hypothetical protein
MIREMGGDITKLATDINLMAGLLLAADDSYDSQVKAQDLLYSNNFANSDGGIEWHYKKMASSGQPAQPPDTESKKKLAQFNHWQTQYDVTTKALAQARWDLWALWWKLVSGFMNDATKQLLQTPKKTGDTSSPAELLRSELAKRRKDVETTYNLITTLSVQQSHLRQQLDHSYSPNGTITEKDQSDYQPSSKDPFFQRNDPTVSLVGMPNPWNTVYAQTSSNSADGTNNAMLRFGDNVPTQGAVPDNLISQTQCLKSKDGDKFNLDKIAGGILEEFVRDTNNASGADSEQKPWLKSWNDTQPFFPLFVEIEMIYYHIPWKLWSLETVTSGDLPQTTVRYVVTSDLSASDHMDDVRAISGRVPILPQQALSLSSMIARLLQSNLENVEAVLPSPDDEIVIKGKDGHVTLNKEEVDKLKYLSLPLSGITHHLTTRVAGTHVKPNARLQGQGVQAVKEAWLATQIDPADDVPIFQCLDVVKAMDAQTALTPYGNLQNFVSEKPPFKAVTHGQAMITKLNIVDKFGQVIPALPPIPRKKDKAAIPPALFPCISDILAPGTLSDGSPNVVHRDTSNSGDILNRFIQLTPAINQDARLNCDFVLNSEQGYWRKVQDWEQPIWGWVRQ